MLNLTPFPLTNSGKTILEVIQRPLPRELGGFGVVARRRVVVKAVLRAGIDIDLIWRAGCLQSVFKGGIGRIDAFVVFGQMAKQRGLDVGRRPPGIE